MGKRRTMATLPRVCLAVCDVSLVFATSDIYKFYPNLTVPTSRCPWLHGSTHQPSIKLAAHTAAIMLYTCPVYTERGAASLPILTTCSVDEARDTWRPLFWECFSPLVQAASGVSAAVLSLNKNIWSLWNITFKANQTPDIMSPFQVHILQSPRDGYLLIWGLSSYALVYVKSSTTGLQPAVCVAGDQCRACLLYGAEHIPSQRTTLRGHSCPDGRC